MTPERWKRVNEIFQSALELSPEEQARFVEDACAGDTSLKAEVDSLLAFHQKADSFLESPISKIGSQLLTEDPPKKSESEESSAKTFQEPTYIGLTLKGRYQIEREL